MCAICADCNLAEIQRGAVGRKDCCVRTVEVCLVAFRVACLFYCDIGVRGCLSICCDCMLLICAIGDGLGHLGLCHRVSVSLYRYLRGSLCRRLCRSRSASCEHQTHDHHTCHHHSCHFLHCFLPCISTCHFLHCISICPFHFVLPSLLNFRTSLIPFLFGM